MVGFATVMATAAGPRHEARSRCSSASVSAADGVGHQPLPSAAATSSSADSVSLDNRLRTRSSSSQEPRCSEEARPLYDTSQQHISHNGAHAHMSSEHKAG